jgi:alpha-N-arabinofuranosidase
MDDRRGPLTVTDTPLYPEPISPLIYGDFVEFINDNLPAMRAERVQDRCFEGHRQPRYVYPPGQDWVYPRWQPLVVGRPTFRAIDDVTLNPPSATVRFTLDASAPLVGTQSARIDVAAESGTTPFLAGIAQSSIFVQAGERLRVELFLRAEGAADATVQVLVGQSHGVTFRAYGELAFTGVSSGWKRFSGEFVSPATDGNATLAIGLNRPGTLWIDKVSLRPTDNLLGWRSDVVQAVKEAKPGCLRFGGSSLIYYQWEWGVGPNETRAPFVNHPWENLEENDVGIFEFLEFCELVEAEPLVCVNSNSTSLESVLAEIEFCNSPAESPWGQRRAAMGHPEPFGVRFWQIGNEQEGDAYERVLTEFVRAIRERHPDLVLLASYPSERLLTDLAEAVDYLCPHYYRPYSKEGEARLAALAARVRSGPNPNLKLGITEWNHTAGSWGWGRAWLLTLYNALNAARMLNLFHRLGDTVRIANRSNMINSCCSGAIQTRPGDLYVTPCYHVMRAYATKAGDQALDVALAPDETLDVSATRRRADGSLALFVVNGGDEAQWRKICLPAVPSRGAEWRGWTLTGPTLDAVNSFEEKDRVAPVEGSLGLASQTLEYEFPPLSLTILELVQG